MALFTPSTPRMSRTLRVLAHLLRYPGGALRAHLGELGAALHAERALGAARLAELDALIDQLGRLPAYDVEAAYVELFDRGRSSSLNLFEHVHGESRERGAAMVALAQTYEQAGLQLQPGQLPDYLPVALEYASTQPAARSRAFLAEFAHLLRIVFSALLRRGSPYASVLAALLDLAGERAEKVELPEEPPLDETWAEPAAFDGCSSAGQSRPPGSAAAQPIRIVKPQRADAQGARP
ncbi:MAG: nitrate reductase molybdenum cofactor assembly chaperone [Proteobacteria bacterium]|nr:nitrate reductase molybdenum cofactor assembly chaperone [Pseudomonadota bacterium]HOL36822.1 nitrate reductase molybdenum cofactor assembly chaperone [Rubrivivax sp.]